MYLFVDSRSDSRSLWLKLLVGLLVVGFHGSSLFAQTPNRRVASAPVGGDAWINLFNGHNLEGWTVKIAGHPLGENYANTFRVEDGILKCEYDDYGEFGGRYGHLFSNLAYSHYKLRLEYRFVGRMLPDAPSYVDLNSGVMLHSQPPQSMELNQGFPASLEMQFLADLGNGERQTGNVCTPGTHLVYDGKLTKQHIVKSSGPTLPAGDWVSVEMEVRGHDEIIYRVAGKEVLRYRNPELDPESVEAKPIIAAGAEVPLSFGHIALQAEAQRVWFRNIQLLPLPMVPELNAKSTTSNEFEQTFEIEPGFESLFNGTDLSGWNYLPTTEQQRKSIADWQRGDPHAPPWPIIEDPISFDGATQTHEGRFVAKAGTLVVTEPPEGRKIQMLYTQREFDQNFTLKLEFRAATGADSGVFIRGQQLQCRDYPNAGPYKNLKKFKPNDWNELIVVVTGNRAHCTCNGELLEDAMEIPATGPIGVEGDQGQLEYRRIRLATALAPTEK